MKQPPVIQPQAPNPNLRSCHHCRGVVSKDAHSCPHCGAPFFKQQKQARHYGCGTLLLVLIVGAIVVAAINNVIQSREDQKDPAAAAERKQRNQADWDGQMAWMHARDTCKEHLKAPSTAKFTSLVLDSKTGWVLLTTNKWQAWGRVDAQNSFGATLRHDWIAHVSKSGDTYKVTYLRLGDQQFGNAAD